MKHWKKICGAALALMLSVTCVACGGTPDSGKVPDDPDKPDTPTTDVKIPTAKRRSKTWATLT